jgi:hypothetical protein
MSVTKSATEPGRAFSFLCPSHPQGAPMPLPLAFVLPCPVRIIVRKDATGAAGLA